MMKARRQAPPTAPSPTNRKPALKRRGKSAAAATSQPPVPTRWQWHFKILHDLRDRVLKDRGDQLAEATAPVERYSSHMGDSGSDEFDHDRALGLLAQEQDMLFEIDAAIQRIVAGKYGICEETGQPIAEARLRAIPWTRYAKRVEDRLERQGIAGKPQPAENVAFHHLPQGPRARDEELSVDGEDLDDPRLVENPELITLAVPAAQRREVIEALENGIAENNTQPKPLDKTKALSIDEPIPVTEL